MQFTMLSKDVFVFTLVYSTLAHQEWSRPKEEGFEEGFPPFKHLTVIWAYSSPSEGGHFYPLLKKLNLDMADLGNFHPVTFLFGGKVIEKVAAMQLQQFWDQKNVWIPFNRASGPAKV